MQAVVLAAIASRIVGVASIDDELQRGERRHDEGVNGKGDVVDVDRLRQVMLPLHRVGCEREDRVEEKA